MQGHSSQHLSLSDFVPDTSPGVFLLVILFNRHEKPMSEHNLHFIHEETEFTTCSKLNIFTLQGQDLNSVLSLNDKLLNPMLYYCVES